MFIKSLVVTTVIGLSSLPLSACMDTGDHYYGQYDDFYGAPFYDEGNFDHRGHFGYGDFSHHDYGGFHGYGGFGYQEQGGGHDGGHGMGSSGHGAR